MVNNGNLTNDMMALFQFEGTNKEITHNALDSETVNKTQDN